MIAIFHSARATGRYRPRGARLQAGCGRILGYIASDWSPRSSTWPAARRDVFGGL